MIAKKNNIRKNRKGVLGSQLVDIVVAVLIIMVAIYLIWNYVLHGSGDSINSLQTCGNLAVGKGLCKESCNPDTEQGFQVGCSGVKNTCCISTSGNTVDSMLPSPYGGNADYNFIVSYIGFTTYDLSKIGKCQFDDSPTNTVLRCLTGSSVTLPIKIGIVGGGNSAAQLYASPVMTFNDDPGSIKQTYAGTQKVSVSKNQKAEVTTTITISASDAVSNSYWKIYPYAICDTAECSKASLGGKGIMKNIIGGQTFLTIKFVDS